MKKTLSITIIILFLIATPAFAANENANGKAQKNSQSQKNVLQESVTPTPTISENVTPTTSPTLTPTITNTPTVTPVTDSSNNGKRVLGQNAKNKQSSENNEECSPTAEYKNHGEYVSCVAKQGLGGQAVSAAARSDIGKKKSGITPTVTPSGTPSATPTLTPTITPPLTSPVLGLGGNFDPLKSISSLVENFVDFITNLV